eukprot:Pgem_evm1s1053
MSVSQKSVHNFLRIPDQTEKSEFEIVYEKESSKLFTQRVNVFYKSIEQGKTPTYKELLAAVADKYVGLSSQNGPRQACQLLQTFVSSESEYYIADYSAIEDIPWKIPKSHSIYTVFYDKAHSTNYYNFLRKGEGIKFLKNLIQDLFVKGYLN